MNDSSSTNPGSVDLIGFFTTLLPRFYAAYQASLAREVALLSIPGSPIPHHLGEIFVAPALVEWRPEASDGIGNDPGKILSEQSGRLPSPSEPLDIWEAMRRYPLLALVGPSGIGKSALLRYLAWQCASDKAPRHQIRLLSFERHDEPIENLVPVYLSLVAPSLAGGDILARMVHLFAEHGFPRARRFLLGKLQRGECLLLFDDVSQISHEHERERVVAEILALAEQYGRNQIIVAARTPGDLGLTLQPQPHVVTVADQLGDATTGWSASLGDQPQGVRFGVIRHDGFSRQAAQEFVRRWFADRRSHSQGEPGSGLLDMLMESPGLTEIAGCPLCLTAMLAAEDSRRGLRGARLTPLFERSSQVLRTQPDGYVEAKVRPGGDAEAGTSDTALLEDIAQHLHLRKARTLLPEQIPGMTGPPSPATILGRLADSHLLQQSVDGSYRFAHQVWQAYFAARALSRLGVVSIADISEHADDPWWHDVIVFMAGQQQDATDLVRSLHQISSSREPRSEAAAEPLFLAARCVAEAQHTEAGLRDELLKDLLAIFGQPEPELWTRASLAVAGVMGKNVSEAFPELLKTGPVERRAAAATALGRIGGDWAIAAVKEALWDANDLVRQRAAWTLGQIGGTASVQPLIQTLNDPDEEVRASAVEALATLGWAAVPSLVGSLADGRPFVSEAAVDALSRIGAPAVEPLVRALRDPRGEVGRHAVECLARIARPALGPLISALGDDDAVVRQRAARALGEIDLEDCVPALITRLDDSEEVVCLEVRRALVRFGQRATQPLVMVLGTDQSDARQRAIEVLQAIGPPGIQALSHALGHEDRNIRRRAAEALGIIGSEQAVDALSGALDDERSEVRRRAVEALGQIGGAQARDALIRALADSEPGVRRQAVAALGGLENDERALVALVDALRDQDRNVREMATQVLGRVRRRHLVDPFISALRDEDVYVRRRAAAALGHERDERAVGPLIEALSDNDFQVRELAAAALGRQGTLTVEPLIQAVYDLPPYHPARRLGVRVLGEVSIHDREADTWLAGLAGTYFEIWTREHTLDELLHLFSRLQWWPHGFELLQSFSAARTFLGYKHVADLARCAQELAWMPSVAHWLRPALRDVLTAFGRVGEYVNLYLTAPQQSARHEGLIGAIYRLEELREVIYERLDQSEAEVFGQVAGHWRELLAQARRQMAGGQASLALEVRAETILLGRPGAPVILSVELINSGESPARNLSLTLRQPLTGGFEIEESDRTRPLYPLGSGERRIVEFAVVPHGPGEVELTFEARYADNETPDGFRLLSGRARFQRRRAPYVPLPRSPYITGLPVKTRAMFFGREDVFAWVRDNLRGRYQDNVLVLWGQRRTGKTSVLYQLRARPPSPEYTFLLVDLQGLIHEIRDHGGLFHGVAQRMHEQLEKLKFPVTKPNRQEYTSYPEERFRDFCKEIERHLEGRKVVLMLDEFDILLDKVRDGVIDEEVFGFIRGLMQHSEKLSFMFSGTYELRKKQQERGWILFNTAISRKISYLEPDAALRLIEEPMEGLLSYHRLATEKLLSVTAGQPYYIQYICNTLVDLARHQRKNDVDLTDVNEALEMTVDEVMGTLNEDFETLSQPERWTLAALAHISGEGKSLVPRVEIEAALKDAGLSMPVPKLMNALQQLVERDFVEERTEGQRFLYGFRMELTRMWLRQSRKLERLREEV